MPSPTTARRKPLRLAWCSDEPPARIGRVREADVPAELEFWALLGFERVEPPPPINEIAVWVQREGTQIHFLFTDEPVVPQGGHVAVVAEDWQAAFDRLRDAGFAPEEHRAAVGSGAGVRPHPGGPPRGVHGTPARPLRASRTTGLAEATSRTRVHSHRRWASRGRRCAYGLHAPPPPRRARRRRPQEGLRRPSAPARPRARQPDRPRLAHTGDTPWRLEGHSRRLPA